MGAPDFTDAGQQLASEMGKDDGMGSEGIVGMPLVIGASDSPMTAGKKKWLLLAIYSFAMFVDSTCSCRAGVGADHLVWSYSSFFIFTDQISVDLGVPFEQQSWIIVGHALTPRCPLTQ